MKKNKKLKIINKYNLKNKYFKINKIFKIIKKLNFVKFNSSIDLYINVYLKNKKDIFIHKNILLPYGNGKKYKILLLVQKNIRYKFKKFKIDYIGGNKYINKIKNDKWIKFNIIITTTYYMNKLLKLGKILGTKNLMPNINNNTITDNPYDVVKNLIDGKKNEIKINKNNNNIINLTIGKISFDENKLIKNLEYVLYILKNLKKKYNFIYIKNIYISSTMGPSLKLFL
ncbi:MAG: 50S ribosomal protein L1 [Candidatus Shikimatogenerans bostrichidophilus]|nr:MAG: 50S ribosomal protein L1 [Candidatus Shikimatogenerans bostrichidophilus]